MLLFCLLEELQRNISIRKTYSK